MNQIQHFERSAGRSYIRAAGALQRSFRIVAPQRGAPVSQVSSNRTLSESGGLSCRHSTASRNAPVHRSFRRFWLTSSAKRRRDNLASAIHLLVEAHFLLHPLEAQGSVEEREQACDEEPLGRRGESRNYAEAILSICKLYAESLYASMGYQRVGLINGYLPRTDSPSSIRRQ